VAISHVRASLYGPRLSRLPCCHGHHQSLSAQAIQAPLLPWSPSVTIGPGQPGSPVAIVTISHYRPRPARLARCRGFRCYAFISLFSRRMRCDFRVVNLDSRHLWQMNSSGIFDLRILAHDKWTHVKHSEHSIMGRPANGFIQ
jgi:hypothetical protein